jgi:hypothetical protein
MSNVTRFIMSLFKMLCGLVGIGGAVKDFGATGLVKRQRQKDPHSSNQKLRD